MSATHQSHVPHQEFDSDSEGDTLPTEDALSSLLGQASEWLRCGRLTRAMSAYRQVLEMDPTRAGVAQRVAWIEREEQAQSRIRTRRWTCVLLVFLVALIGSWITTREGQLKLRVSHLPAVRSDDPNGIAKRVAAMDALLAEHSLWIGGIALRKERDQLLAQARLHSAAQSRRERELQARLERQELAAEATCVKGRRLIESGLLAEAREVFAQAARTAPDGSDLSEQIQAELDAIDQRLELDQPANPLSIASRKPYSAGGQ